MENTQHIAQIIGQAKGNLSPDLLIIILGPTASGKTKLAVQVAEAMKGEILSADSRQVYRGMDIGTGKDIKEYGSIPYHIIDIKDPGEKYNVNLFRQDFFTAYDHIRSRNTTPILCGGTGSYIQSILQDSPYSQIPKSTELQEQLAKLPKEELIANIRKRSIPKDLNIDFDSHKRLVRALEILLYLQENNPCLHPQRTVRQYLAFGINPPVQQRRESITKRLRKRIGEGLVDEVESLLANGLSHEDLLYYGLEYKYASLYLQGKLNIDGFFEKLNTEIHRYAKRQMTYFRKMEKDGVKIHWL